MIVTFRVVTRRTLLEISQAFLGMRRVYKDTEAKVSQSYLG